MADPQHNQANGPRRHVIRTLAPSEGERHASWLELFFDLVFVLAVAQIAHSLTEHADLFGFLKFIALFVPVWWSWVGFTFYSDRFESDDWVYRVLMFAGMLAIIGVAMTLGDSFTASGDFALIICYVLVRLVLITLYLRTAYLIPLARAFALQYPIGLGISSILFLISLSLAGNARYIMWAVAFLVELATPLLNLRAARVLPIDRSHIPERFGLFTIIVLGEAVIAAATGLGGVAWNTATITAASLGFAMAAATWWLNFDFVEDSALISGSLLKRFVYIYGHFFMVASIVATGVGVEHAIKETNEAHLHLSTIVMLVGGVAVYISAITIVRLVTGICKVIVPRMGAVAVLLLLIFAGQFIPPLAVFAITVGVLVAEVRLEGFFSVEHSVESGSEATACEHVPEATVFTASSKGCEECIENGYKWVHLRLCLSCGHVGCCDSSVYKHATKHFRSSDHPIIASLEPAEEWAWCYIDGRFVAVSGIAEMSVSD